MTIEAYPLYWPSGRARTRQPEIARFSTTFARARNEVIRQIEMLTDTRSSGDAQIVISTNMPLRRDGLPLASARRPDDCGVAVYFSYKGQQRCFACDRWNQIADNMQAISKTIEALRGIARWGTGDMLDAAFRGFDALPPPTSGPRPSWWEILGVPRDAPFDAVRAAYLRAASQAHPDRGGSNELMSEINRAWTEAQEALRL